MVESGEEITQYVKNVMKGISEALPDGFEISSPIKFDLSVVKTKGAGGGVMIQVVTLGAAKNKEEISRITFEIQTKELGLRKLQSENLERITKMITPKG